MSSELELDALLKPDARMPEAAAPTPTQSAEEDLERILQSEEPGGRRSAGQIRHEEKSAATNGALKRERDQAISERDQANGRFARSQRAVWALMMICGAQLLGVGAVVLWAQTQDARSLARAFKIIHYRENRALAANAVVLDEWDKRIENLAGAVAGIDGMQDDERAERVKTLNALRAQAQHLRTGFMQQLAENEKERNVGGGFSYRDPYLKREIDLNEEMGGKIDLEKLKEDVKKSANLDQTMKSLEEAMLNPVPLSEQVRREAEAQRQTGTLSSVDLTKGLAGQQVNGATNPFGGK